MYRPTLNNHHTVFRTSIGENSTSLHHQKHETCPSVADSERTANEISPVLKLYENVKLRSRSSGRDFGTYSLADFGGNYPVHIIAIHTEDQKISLPEIESIEMSIGGILCGGSNIFFTRQYELDMTGEVSTMFCDAPVPIKLVFDTELRDDQMEDPDDLVLDIDQPMTLLRMEIELGEEWRKLIGLIQRVKTSPPDRSQRPRLSKLRSSFRLSKRFSSRDLDHSCELSVSSNEEVRPTKEIRKALKECRELRLQGPRASPIYCRIPLETSSGQRRKGEWIVPTTDTTSRPVQDVAKMLVARGGVVYRFSDSSLKRDWSSRGQNTYKVHFDKSGLSWVSLHINTTTEDHENLRQLMSESLSLQLSEFLTILDRPGLKCRVVDLAFAIIDVQDWFQSLGIDL